MSEVSLNIDKEQVINLPVFLSNIFNGFNQYITNTKNLYYNEFEERFLKEEELPFRSYKNFKTLLVWDSIRKSKTYNNHDINDPYFFVAMNIITNGLICAVLDTNTIQIRKLVKKIAIELSDDTEFLDIIDKYIKSSSYKKQIKEVIRNFKRIGTRFQSPKKENEYSEIKNVYNTNNQSEIEEISNINNQINTQKEFSFTNNQVENEINDSFSQDNILDLDKINEEKYQLIGKKRKYK